MSAFVSYRSAKVRVATGTRLHYAEFGKPDGRPVLFLHGWPDSWFSFSRVLRLLPDELRALAIDQRGFGESDRPESGYTIPEMADDAIAFLDALRIPRATVVGHSFGSFVARRAAIAHPERVTALALIGTGLSGSNAVTRELQSSLRDLPDPIPVQWLAIFRRAPRSVRFRRISSNELSKKASSCRRVSGDSQSIGLSNSTMRRNSLESRRRRSYCGATRTRCFRGRSNKGSSTCCRRHAFPSMRRPATARIGSSRNASRPTSWRSRRKPDQLVDFARAVSSPASWRIAFALAASDALTFGAILIFRFPATKRRITARAAHTLAILAPSGHFAGSGIGAAT